MSLSLIEKMTLSVSITHSKIALNNLIKNLSSTYGEETVIVRAAENALQAVTTIENQLRAIIAGEADANGTIEYEDDEEAPPDETEDTSESEV